MRYIGVNPNLSGLAIRGTVREAAALPNLSILYILTVFSMEPFWSGAGRARHAQARLDHAAEQLTIKNGKDFCNSKLHWEFSYPSTIAAGHASIATSLRQSGAVQARCRDSGPNVEINEFATRELVG